MFTLAISFDHFQFSSIHGLNIPGSYAISFFTVSIFTFTARYIHKWVSFLLSLRLFIPSGAISLLFSSSILYTYHSPFSVISFCLSITVHGVLNIRMLSMNQTSYQPEMLGGHKQNLACPRTRGKEQRLATGGRTTGSSSPGRHGMWHQSSWRRLPIAPP